MKKKLDLENGNLTELFISFAMPATISLIMTFLYTVADGIFITRGVGSAGIAAVNIGYPIINFTVALSLMFGIGGATLITFKKGDIKYQNKYFSHIIFLNIVVYIIVAIAIFLFTNPVMMALGASEELLPMIKGYMYPCTVSTSFLMIATSLNAVVRSDNAPKRAMKSTLIGAGMNIVLDYLFIFKFHLGIEGGAYATACDFKSTSLIKDKNKRVGTHVSTCDHKGTFSDKTKNKFLGPHVSTTGGVFNAPKNAKEIGARAFALFLKNQRRWDVKPYTDEDIAKFKKAMVENGYSADYVLPHDSYLINLGAEDTEKREKSLNAFIDEMKRCEAL
ncbi:MATE family efflux transporter, partial [uncultured Fusobacterium sp.]|uniref:MATE family efflux transporter n=1 Tax=uncultured Fusobacterium sp. TaxID=159267 RepID=UPI0025CC82F7